MATVLPHKLTTTHTYIYKGYIMDLKTAETRLALITPQIIKLETQGKTAYTDAKCSDLWKEARELTKIIKLLKL